jgi:indole-3-glycerol phosphate synthase
MPDFLDRLAIDALDTIKSGYYEETIRIQDNEPISLKNSLMHSKGNPIIAEIKAASPSKGSIKKNINSIALAELMMKGGAAGLSVLTEPKHFNGSTTYVSDIRAAHSYPILMKDFILSVAQVKTARKLGASAILLISTLYNRGYGEIGLEETINIAHREGLEVLLETHSIEEFKTGLYTDADLIGINNRDLKTLKTDIKFTESILRQVEPVGKIVVSESGIKNASDIVFLRNCGAKAYLVGSSIMESDDPQAKVKELVNA